jgi:hypothetical protein
MEFTEELILKFALFHARRMRGASQSDSEYYVKQSMKMFIELKGDVTNFNFW